MEATENGVATISSTVTCRLRREDCRHTKYDSAFSPWKILIGPSDWEDHAQGKEGAEKYSVKNLPNCSCCSGVYEFGIVLSRHQSGRETSKLDPDLIIPVYLGKSDNVRHRLQQYGREGAHLENGSFNGKLNDCNNVLAGKSPGLFSEIFKTGFSIVYRWAPMTNAREAAKTEAELLAKFDYAWNKDSNGARRRDDILKKIHRSTGTPQSLQKLQFFHQRRKGIKIKACQPLLEDGYDFYMNLPPDNLFARVIKFGRSQPMLVPWRFSVDENGPSICGVALGHGIVCKKPPSEGRKRCAEHKGMKIKATSSKLFGQKQSALAMDKHLDEQVIGTVCGVILPDGSSCTMEPILRNKRCLEHKGQKIQYSVHQSVKAKQESYVYGPIMDYGHNKYILSRKAGGLNTSTGEKVANENVNPICGVDLEDGTFCTRQPPAGRKRCEEHKGMRATVAIPKSFIEEVPCVFDSPGAKSCSQEKKKNLCLPSVFSDNSSPTCGTPLQDGGFCSRIPVKGNKTCWQHKGMMVEQDRTFSSIKDEQISRTCGAPLRNGSFCTRNPREGNKRCWQHENTMVDASSRSSTFISYYDNTASRYSSIGSVYEKISPTCGAPLQNGSFCSRNATEGNKRCWQHKYTRVDASSRSSSYTSDYDNTAFRYSSIGSVSGTCGARCRDGSYCRRPSSGGRCWQHENTMVDASSRSSSYISDYDTTAFRYSSIGSVSRTCGARCRDGSYCGRRSSGGRCWQHGG